MGSAELAKDAAEVVPAPCLEVVFGSYSRKGTAHDNEDRVSVAYWGGGRGKRRRRDSSSCVGTCGAKVLHSQEFHAPAPVGSVVQRAATQNSSVRNAAPDNNSSSSAASDRRDAGNCRSSYARRLVRDLDDDRERAYAHSDAEAEPEQKREAPEESDRDTRVCRYSRELAETRGPAIRASASAAAAEVAGGSMDGRRERNKAGQQQQRALAADVERRSTAAGVDSSMLGSADPNEAPEVLVALGRVAGTNRARAAGNSEAHPGREGDDEKEKEEEEEEPAELQRQKQQHGEGSSGVAEKERHKQRQPLSYNEGELRKQMLPAKRAASAAGELDDSGLLLLMPFVAAKRSKLNRRAIVTARRWHSEGNRRAQGWGFTAMPVLIQSTTRPQQQGGNQLQERRTNEQHKLWVVPNRRVPPEKELSSPHAAEFSSCNISLDIEEGDVADMLPHQQHEERFMPKEKETTSSVAPDFAAEAGSADCIEEALVATENATAGRCTSSAHASAKAHGVGENVAAVEASSPVRSLAADDRRRPGPVVVATCAAATSAVVAADSAPDAAEAAEKHIRGSNAGQQLHAVPLVDDGAFREQMQQTGVTLCKAEQKQVHATYSQRKKLLLPKDEDPTFLFTVCDGHDGPSAAVYAAVELPKMLCSSEREQEAEEEEQQQHSDTKGASPKTAKSIAGDDEDWWGTPKKNSTSNSGNALMSSSNTTEEGDWQSAANPREAAEDVKLKRIFAALDSGFRQECQAISASTGSTCTSGTCVISLLVRGNTLVCQNVGDCRAALLTFDVAAGGRWLHWCMRREKARSRSNCEERITSSSNSSTSSSSSSSSNSHSSVQRTSSRNSSSNTASISVDTVSNSGNRSGNSKSRKSPQKTMSSNNSRRRRYDYYEGSSSSEENLAGAWREPIAEYDYSVKHAQQLFMPYVPLLEEQDGQQQQHRRQGRQEQQQQQQQPTSRSVRGAGSGWWLRAAENHLHASGEDTEGQALAEEFFFDSDSSSSDNFSSHVGEPVVSEEQIESAVFAGEVSDILHIPAEHKRAAAAVVEKNNRRGFVFGEGGGREWLLRAEEDVVSEKEVDTAVALLDVYLFGEKNLQLLRTLTAEGSAATKIAAPAPAARDTMGHTHVDSEAYDNEGGTGYTWASKRGATRILPELPVPATRSSSHMSVETTTAFLASTTTTQPASATAEKGGEAQHSDSTPAAVAAGESHRDEQMAVKYYSQTSGKEGDERQFAADSGDASGRRQPEIITQHHGGMTSMQDAATADTMAGEGSTQPQDVRDDEPEEIPAEYGSSVLSPSSISSRMLPCAAPVAGGGNGGRSGTGGPSISTHTTHHHSATVDQRAEAGAAAAPPAARAATEAKTAAAREGASAAAVAGAPGEELKMPTPAGPTGALAAKEESAAASALEKIDVPLSKAADLLKGREQQSDKSMQQAVSKQHDTQSQQQKIFKQDQEEGDLSAWQLQATESSSSNSEYGCVLEGQEFFSVEAFRSAASLPAASSVAPAAAPAACATRVAATAAETRPLHPTDALGTCSGGYSLTAAAAPAATVVGPPAGPAPASAAAESFSAPGQAHITTAGITLSSSAAMGDTSSSIVSEMSGRGAPLSSSGCHARDEIFTTRLFKAAFVSPNSAPSAASWDVGRSPADGGYSTVSEKNTPASSQWWTADSVVNSSSNAAAAPASPDVSSFLSPVAVAASVSRDTRQQQQQLHVSQFVCADTLPPQQKKQLTHPCADTSHEQQQQLLLPTARAGISQQEEQHRPLSLPVYEQQQRRREALPPALLLQWLSREQRCSGERERLRVRRAGGIVLGGRIAGVLEPSRTIGDFDVKDDQPPGALSCCPEVLRVRNIHLPAIVLLGTDGIWDVLLQQDLLLALREAGPLWRAVVKGFLLAAKKQQRHARLRRDHMKQKNRQQQTAQQHEWFSRHKEQRVQYNSLSKKAGEILTERKNSKQRSEPSTSSAPTESYPAATKPGRGFTTTRVAPILVHGEGERQAAPAAVCASVAVGVRDSTLASSTSSQAPLAATAMPAESRTVGEQTAMAARGATLVTATPEAGAKARVAGTAAADMLNAGFSTTTAAQTTTLRGEDDPAMEAARGAPWKAPAAAAPVVMAPPKSAAAWLQSAACTGGSRAPGRHAETQREQPQQQQQQRLPSGSIHAEYLTNVCERLVRKARRKGSQDDATCLAIFLNPVLVTQCISSSSGTA